MKYTVKWNQWFRSGYHGDDTDFETELKEFGTRDEADQFIEDLVAGKHRGTYDCTVNRSEVTLTMDGNEI